MYDSMDMKRVIYISLMIIVLFNGCGETDLKQTDASDSGKRAEKIFEDAEKNISQAWFVYKGDEVPRRVSPGYQSAYSIYLPVKWEQDEEGNWHNLCEYQLPMYQKGLTILEMDVGGFGEPILHYTVGVKAMTLHGKRNMSWDSWYNHQGYDAQYIVTGEGFATMIFPSPVELVRGHGYERVDAWHHFSVDLNAYLHQFEPENEIVSVDLFVATGGNLDNLKLSAPPSE